MGRPKLPKDMAKSKNLHIRLTEQEYKDIQEITKESGCPSMSSLVLWCFYEGREELKQWIQKRSRMV